MSEPGDKAPWTPTNEPNKRSWQQWVLLAIAVVFLWGVLLTGVVMQEETRNTTPALGNPKNSNLVRVHNDTIEPVYFVPCPDDRCLDIPAGGAHPGDHNLVTPTHKEVFYLKRSNDPDSTFGVFDSDGKLRGCITLRHYKSTEDPQDLDLSDEMHACGSSSIDKGNQTSTTWSDGLT